LRFYFEEIEVASSGRFDTIDVTGKVEGVVRRSGIVNGVVLLYVPHTTAALIVNEAEEGLLEDFIEFFRELTRPGYPWRHNRIDNNAHAHLASALLGPSLLLPVREGGLVRGTWQSIIFLEFDGPRRRRIIVEVFGD